MNASDFSPVAVSFQAIGTLLLCLMLAQIGRIFAWRYARTWALAWLSMFIALTAVRIYIQLHHPRTWIGYLMPEWAFLVLLYSGCRDLASGKPIQWRHALYAIPPAFVLAAIMARLAPSFNDLFTAQAAIMAAGIAASYVILGTSPRDRRSTAWGSLRIALAMLALLYAAYVPLYYTYMHIRPVQLLEYSSLADLLLSIFLGFAMILVTAE